MKYYERPVIIAFDPSLNSSGICVLPLDSDTPIAYECVCTPVEDPARLRYNYDRFRAILSAYADIRYIAFERQINQMRYGNNSGSILALAENIGILKLAILQTLREESHKSIPIIAVPPDHIKKYATGNSKATKEDMMAAVNGNHMKTIRRVIPEHSVNDVADAYHLAKMTKHIVSTGEGLDKYLYVGDVVVPGEEGVCEEVT